MSHLEEKSFDHFDNNPSTSLRRAAAGIVVPREVIRRTLRGDGRHAFHLLLVKELVPGDAERRVEFYGSVEVVQWFGLLGHLTSHR
ncbi:hypothetical protein ABEB36_012802 [Hypothenemus hampei]|uniref:Uncharacterized protein n=1 Tax=Hypothenemus hampei TaxID=57062 RepID=A0ABD1E5V1_HYPHA